MIRHLIACTCCAAGLAFAPVVHADDPPKPEEVKTTKVTRGPLKVDVELTGVIEAAEMFPVAFRPETWTDLIVTKAVEPGRVVKRGEPLVWLETRGIDEQIRDLEFAKQQAELGIKQTQLDAAVAQRTAVLEVEAATRGAQVAEEDLTYFDKTDREFSTKSAQFSFKNAEESLAYAQEELTQLEKMYKEDDLTEETEEIILQRARRQMEQAKFGVEGAALARDQSINFEIPRKEVQLKHAAATNGLALEKAKSMLPLTVHKSRLDFEKAKFEFMKSNEQLARLKKDREGLVLVAPADGIVYYGDCQRGKWATADAATGKLRAGGHLTPHEVIVTVVQPQPLFIRADLPEKDLAELKIGAAGVVTPIASPTTKLAATVTSISPIPVSEGTFDSRTTLVGKSPIALMPGMGVKVKFTPYAKADALLAPAKAVFSEELDEQKKFVYVKQATGPAKKQSVTVGRTSGDNVEILSGVKEGYEILLEKPKS